MFSNKDLERYSRQIILKKVGILGQKKIQNSKVLVVGCGGLGSPVIDLLSRAGIGKIGIMDHDKVTISNLHRQVMFTSDDVGKYKVNILKKKINKINKKVNVKTYKVKAEDKNLDGQEHQWSFFSGTFDFSDDGARATLFGIQLSLIHI